MITLLALFFGVVVGFAIGHFGGPALVTWFKGIFTSTAK